MTHDEPCFSLFNDNRQNLLRRALCACASAEALGDFGGFFTIGGVGKHFVNRFPDGCSFRLVELHACAKLKHARANAALLRRLRKHDQRHAEIQRRLRALRRHRTRNPGSIPLDQGGAGYPPGKIGMFQKFTQQPMIEFSIP